MSKDQQASLIVTWGKLLANYHEMKIAKHQYKITRAQNKVKNRLEKL